MTMVMMMVVLVVVLMIMMIAKMVMMLVRLRRMVLMMLMTRLLACDGLRALMIYGSLSKFASKTSESLDLSASCAAWKHRRYRSLSPPARSQVSRDPEEMCCLILPKWTRFLRFGLM